MDAIILKTRDLRVGDEIAFIVQVTPVYTKIKQIGKKYSKYMTRQMYWISFGKNQSVEYLLAEENAQWRTIRREK